MKEMPIDEALMRMTTGLLHTMKVMALTLEATGALNREVFVHGLETRLRLTDNLEAVPLAMMLQEFAPELPPHPSLRLIQGGKP